MKRRKFVNVELQAVYDELRTMRPRPDPAKYRGMGGGGNAYTLPHEPNHHFPVGTRAYVHWAAGVDNARDDSSVNE